MHACLFAWGYSLKKIWNDTGYSNPPLNQDQLLTMENLTIMGAGNPFSGSTSDRRMDSKKFSGTPGHCWKQPRQKLRHRVEELLQTLTD